MMNTARTWIIALALYVSVAASDATEPLALTTQTTIRWASLEEARTLLQTPDHFTCSLSPFDRAIRLDSDEPVSSQAFLSYSAQQAQEWSTNEAKRLREAWIRLRPRIRTFHLPLPKEILMIKTNGREEPAPYTRQNGIILPERSTRSPQPKDALLAHELFHVLSRNAESIYRSQLYAVLGFKPCSPIELPQQLAARRITNPDSPVYDHYINVQFEGSPRSVIPILLSKTEHYRSENPESFFAYLQQRLLVISHSESQWQPELRNNEPTLLEFDDVTQFYAQIGGKHYSVFQPDEILARHFTKLALGETPEESDSVPGRLYKLLEATAE